MDALLDRSSIRNVNPNTGDSSVLFVGVADWGWASSNADVTAMQMHLVARHSAWFDRFRLRFPPAPLRILSRLRRSEGVLGVSSQLSYDTNLTQDDTGLHPSDGLIWSKS